MNDSTTDRLPPHDEKAERCLLGCCLIEATVGIPEALPIVRGEDLYSSDLKVVWDAMMSLWDAGRPVDLVTMCDTLKASGAYERIGGWQFLEGLMADVATVYRAGEYARIVAGHARRRRLIHACTKASRSAYDLSTPVDDACDEAAHDIFEATRERSQEEMTSIRDVLKDLLTTESGLSRGTALPYPQLDDLLNGLAGGELILLAARPSTGKTTFALNLAAGLALCPSRYPVGFFTMEMSRHALGLNIAAAYCGFDAHKFRRGLLGEAARNPELVAKAKQLAEAPIYIDDTYSLSLRRLRGKLMALKAREPRLLLAVVDYLQLMEAPDSENRQVEVSRLSRGLKCMAKELGVAVLALSQLSRASEARKGGIPRLTDLRESGSLEQDGDKIIFLHRPDRIPPHTERPGECDVIVAKHRNGPTGELLFFFNRSTLRFTEHDEDRPSDLPPYQPR